MRRHPAVFLAAGVVLAGVLFPAGCATRASEPLAGPLTKTDPAVLRGEKLYMRHCNQCHVGGEYGFGPALNNKPAPKFLMRTQVRAGLGAMPAFSKQEIPPSDLDDILAYVIAIRRHAER